jgi:hypothetical protein
VPSAKGRKGRPCYEQRKRTVDRWADQAPLRLPHLSTVVKNALELRHELDQAAADVVTLKSAVTSVAANVPLMLIGVATGAAN